MSAAYAEKEREFVAGLAEDTGRDLAAWMMAISESGQTERNDIIDWLRHQGFQFAWASWLERIHHNGGRLIYADTVPGVARSTNRSASVREAPGEPPSRSRIIRPQPQTPTPPKPPASDIQALLNEAKGLRPLAEHILREIARAVPETEFFAAAPFVTMTAQGQFAALHASPKKLRLYAKFGLAGTNRSRPAEPVGKAMPPFAEMLVLDDARSIDEDFRRLIRAAAAR
jgi:hypothetical protein